MKKYPFSLILFIALLVNEIFRFRVAAWLSSLGSRQLLSYVIYGTAAALIIVYIVKLLLEKRVEKMPNILLCAATLFYFLLSRQVLEYQIGVVAFFIFGSVFCFEARKSGSLGISILLLAAPVTILIVTGLIKGGDFYPVEAIKYFLFAASGFVSCKEGMV